MGEEHSNREGNVAMLNMEDIRRIANQSYKSAGTQAVLTDPMCILLLGAEATRRANELRARLKCRWTNADSHLTVATIRFEEGMTKNDGLGNYVIDPKSGDPNSVEFIKLQLGQVVQIIESDQRRRAPALMNVKVCIITSSRDAEACWAGPLMMLLNAQYQIGGSNVGNAQLFCLLAPNILMLQDGDPQMNTFGSLLTGSWLDASKIDEAMRVFNDPANPQKHVVARINGFYVPGTPIFNQTFFVGSANSLGMEILEDDRLNMLVTFMDPCSNIDWENNERFFSGYLYPNQMEPGADLAIVWHICQHRFSTEYGAQAPATDLKEFNDAHRSIMQEAYEHAQKNVSNALPQKYVTFEGKAEIAKRSKYDFLWLCQYQNMQDKVLEWQKKYEEALCQIWSLDWLKQNESHMFMEYDAQNMNSGMADNGDTPYARFNGEDNVAKINAHVKGLNAWAQDKINQRKVFLNEMQMRTMDALNAASENVCTEVQTSLKLIGLDGKDILEEREKALAVLPQIKNGIYSNYVHHMSHADGRQRLESFLSDTAKIIFDPALALEPYAMPMPATPCYAYRPTPGMGIVNGRLETIQAGMSRGKYYYICTVGATNIPRL